MKSAALVNPIRQQLIKRKGIVPRTTLLTSKSEVTLHLFTDPKINKSDVLVF